MSSIIRLIRRPLPAIRAADWLHDGVLRDALQQVGGVEDRAERIAQVVPQHRREQLVQPQCLGQLPKLIRELPLLPVELEENSALLLMMWGSMGLCRKSTAPVSYPLKTR